MCHHFNIFKEPEETFEHSTVNSQELQDELTWESHDFSRMAIYLNAAELLQCSAKGPARGRGPLPHPVLPPGKEVAEIYGSAPFSLEANTWSSWFTPYIKWFVSVLSSWSKMFYLSQLGKLAVPLPSSAVATVVRGKISQWVWSTKRPRGISQTAGYGPRVWESFFHRVTLGHWLFRWEAVSASLLWLPTRLSSIFPHVMDPLFPSAPLHLSPCPRSAPFLLLPVRFSYQLPTYLKITSI